MASDHPNLTDLSDPQFRVVSVLRRGGILTQTRHYATGRPHMELYDRPEPEDDGRRMALGTPARNTVDSLSRLGVLRYHPSDRLFKGEYRLTAAFLEAPSE